MARTYTPTLLVLARAVLIYVTRHRQKINENLDEGQRIAFDALVTALEALIDIIDHPLNP